MNFLEQLIGEWYQHKGYFVKSNTRVKPRPRGGYDGELDVIAYNPELSHLLHIEASTDTDSWATRETRFRKKFDLGKEFVHSCFPGLDIKTELDQRAILIFASTKDHPTIGGGKVVPVAQFMKEIYDELSKWNFAQKSVHENYPTLRSIHLMLDNLKRF